MGFFLRPAGPRALGKDLANFWRNRPRGQWIAGTLAIAATSAIVIAFFVDYGSVEDHRERVTYIDSWPATRTDEQIKAKQNTDRERREARAAESRRRMQEIDQSLNRLGI